MPSEQGQRLGPALIHQPISRAMPRPSGGAIRPPWERPRKKNLLTLRCQLGAKNPLAYLGAKGMPETLKGRLNLPGLSLALCVGAPKEEDETDRKRCRYQGGHGGSDQRLPASCADSRTCRRSALAQTAKGL